MADTNYQWAAHYEPAGSRCSGRATPGALALRKALSTVFDPSHPKQPPPVHGLYNCRTVRGRSTPSMHGTGRAIDYMTSGSHGDRVLAALGAQGDELGIQFVIWAAGGRPTKFGPRYPQGAPYGGVSPHTDHLHIELTTAAGRSLTYERALRLLRAEADGGESATPTIAGDDTMLMVQKQGEAAVYTVGDGGKTLHHIPNRQTAELIAGASWQKQVKVLPASHFLWRQAKVYKG